MNETIEFENRTWCWHQKALQYSFCPDPNEVPQSTNTGNLYFIHIGTVNIFYLITGQSCASKYIINVLVQLYRPFNFASMEQSKRITILIFGTFEHKYIVKNIFSGKVNITTIFPHIVFDLE